MIICSLRIKIILKENGLEFNEKMAKEGYALIVKRHNVILMAKTTTGLFYAIQSLQFLLRNRGETNALPCVKIVDWPNFTMRGITDDISRGQVSIMDNFKKIIRFLVHYKMNVYMPYLEDLLQFKSYPSIGKNRGALSAAECIELQDYAKQYHVDIIPIFQALGHWENLLFQTEFIELADFPGSASLNTTNDKAYQFLERTLAEIVPLFRSVYFHIGADESFDVGKGASRQNACRHGIATIHARHYHRVINILKKYNMYLSLKVKKK